MSTVMQVVHVVVNVLLVLAAGVWMGGLVVLSIAVRLIDSAMKGRRTEGRQIVRRLRGLFQKIELYLMGVLWVAGCGRLLLEQLFSETYPGGWTSADSIAVGMLVVATIAAAYSSFYLTGAIRRAEGGLGSYDDKNKQIRVRKKIALSLKQAEALAWLKAVMAAGVLALSVVALALPRESSSPAKPAATQPAENDSGPTTQPG